MKDKNELLDGMYEFMAEAYKGNWQYRWKGVPFLTTGKDRMYESVMGHVWGCMAFWYFLRRICPNLDKLVDTVEVYEELLQHDTGEFMAGDVSLYKFIKGEDSGKKNERDALRKMSSRLNSSKFAKEILKRFDKHEENIEKINKLEVLVAKFIDHIQGGHYVMVYGKGLASHSKVINKILSIRFFPYAKRLMSVLKERDEEKAFKEVREVVWHHVGMVEKRGVDVDLGDIEL